MRLTSGRIIVTRANLRRFNEPSSVRINIMCAVANDIMHNT